MNEKIEVKFDLGLNDLITQWCRQAGHFEKTVKEGYKEKKYMESLTVLVGLFAKHSDELDDGSFVRIFRFFRDFGLLKRLSKESNIYERHSKLEHKEPE